MAIISFADVAHPALSFNSEIESQRIILKLIDTSWVQRLRFLHQTANTRLVYMFSEHSRFGHSLGVAYLAEQLMDHLERDFPDKVEHFRSVISAAALLHDVGHLAPGSHGAFRTWYPNAKDNHEELAAKIITQDPKISEILGPERVKMVVSILNESPEMPPWTWEIISGGGWNVDRGNWCLIDSILAGVSYGRYNIPALTESMIITDDGHLALGESRLDAMMHFAISRHALYRQVYQHRVLLAADTINRAIVQRARDLGSNLNFADPHMKLVLESKNANDLQLSTIFAMRESWWENHLTQWTAGGDKILTDLCDRLTHRRLFKTVRVDNDDRDEILREAKTAVSQCGFDPNYYVHEISTVDTQSGDLERSMPVLFDDGGIEKLTDADPLFNTLLKESKYSIRRWIAIPAEAKLLLGRKR